MQRLKSVDTFRGLSMMWMFLGHLQGWALRKGDQWLASLTFSFVDPIGAAAFLFMSGISTALSYRDRTFKREGLEEIYSQSRVKNEYLFRALIILIMALIYNSCVAIGILDPLQIWKWFFLLTIAFSLFLAWPFLKTSKLFRLGLGFGIWIANYSAFVYLSDYQGQFNSFYGILYYILYNSPDQDPIFHMFSFFLIGTVLGDIIFETFQINDKEKRYQSFKKNLLFPSILGGVCLIVFGVTFQFPMFLHDRTFIWSIYSLGIQLVLLSVLMLFEDFELVKTKKSHKFLFYFSYYSFTVYLSHYLLFFVFTGQLNVVTIWPYVIITVILFGLLLRAIYKKWGPKASLNYQIGRMASHLARRTEERKKIKNIKVE